MTCAASERLSHKFPYRATAIPRTWRRAPAADRTTWPDLGVGATTRRNDGTHCLEQRGEDAPSRLRRVSGPRPHRVRAERRGGVARRLPAARYGRGVPE